MADIFIQPCLQEHLPQILDIYNYYVRESISTFDIEERPLSFVESNHRLALEAGLPYLVALLPAPKPADVGTVVGYTYATQLRSRRAYAASVELSLFCHPSHKGKGYGAKMLHALIQSLRETPKSANREHGVKELLTVCSLNPSDDLRVFYRRFGFKDVGHLENVGFKFGKWWDTAYGQLSLRDEEEIETLEKEKT